MSIRKTGGKRNYAYGRSIKFAIRQALVDQYGSGRFSNRHTLQARLRVFCRYLSERGVKDLNDVECSTLLEYSAYLRKRVSAGSLAISTAVNYLSATNCLMNALRSDKKVWVSPKEVLGTREYVRRVAPEGMNPVSVIAASNHLASVGEARLGRVLLLARFLGLRFKEASLVNFHSCHKEARKFNCVTIEKGTKGGRKRKVHTSADAERILADLVSMFPRSINLVPKEWSYIRWSRYCYKTWCLHSENSGLHCQISDLRAAFACRLYEDATGVKAPVFTGGRTVDRHLDELARMTIATQLGHSRTQIAGSYIGTSVKARR